MRKYYENKREEKRRGKSGKEKNRKDGNYPYCQKFKEMKRNFRKMSRIRIK